MKRKHRTSGRKANWTQNQKLEVATTYAVLGNMKEVSLLTSVPYETLKGWKTADWFKDLLVQVRDEDIAKLDSNLQRVIDKALKATEDRIDQGDYQYNPKTGKLLRVPVKASVALKVTTELLTKQEKLRDRPDKQEVEKTIDARLSKLAEEFTRFARAKVIEAIPETTYKELVNDSGV